MIVWALEHVHIDDVDGCECEIEVMRLCGVYSTWEKAQKAAEEYCGEDLQWERDETYFFSKRDEVAPKWYRFDIDCHYVDDIHSEETPAEMEKKGSV